MGNLIPLCMGLPFLVMSVSSYRAQNPLAPVPFIWFAGFLFASWIGLNVFGFYGNGAMRKVLGRSLDRSRGPTRQEKYFVGFSRPQFKSLLDAHEDIGFLILHDSEVEFVGECQNVSLAKEHIQEVRFRPNMHTWVGVGGWTSFEGTLNGKPYRLQIELRESPVLFLNMLKSRALRARIRQWLKATKPPAELEASGGDSII